MYSLFDPTPYAYIYIHMYALIGAMTLYPIPLSHLHPTLNPQS
jgi:hypothetical protein